MNIERSLKRIWIFGSGLWIILWIFGFTVNTDWDTGWVIFWTGIIGFAIWWALYWGISGFFSDEDKRDEDEKDY